MDKTISKLLQITLLVELRTEANALNWKLNGTTSSMSCLTGVRTIRLFLCLLQLPQNGPYRGSYDTKNPTVEVISCCYKSQKSASSNAWPERRASALKRLKTHLRNSLKKEMLESLLHISINGPPVKESEAVINKAVALWKEKKQRRKLPRPSRLQQNERATLYAKRTRRAGSNLSIRRFQEGIGKESLKQGLSIKPSSPITAHYASPKN